MRAFEKELWNAHQKGEKIKVMKNYHQRARHFLL